MATWRIPSDQVERFAKEAIGFNAITHCYEQHNRPGLALQYVHDDSRPRRGRLRCRDSRALAERTGQRDFVTLLSVREFKKTWTRL